MQTLIPWRRPDLFEGFRDMDALVRQFFGRPPVATNGGSLAETWAPHCDIEETDKDIVVKADLPGVEPKDVDVSIHEGSLVVRGDKKIEKEDAKKNYHRLERFVGQFYRAIPLPPGTDVEKITAQSANGTITITIPKKPVAQPRKIAVNAE